MRKAVLNLLARPAQSLRWIWFGAALLSVLPVSLAGEVAALRWGTGVLKQPDAWYATPYARSAADNLLLYQSPVGAWPKNTDLLAPATPEALAEVEKGGKADTIDNGATTLPLRFLARIAAATGEPRYLEAARRGVDYLLAAQYPNGGFPQFYPLRKGYYSHVTFNDGAMIHALQVLRDVAQGRAPFEFLDDEHRSRAGAAVSRGIDCILKTQVRQEGRPTVWCAQYDENTLEPAWARKYEPPSLSGAESVGAVRFLMAVEDPSPELIAAVEGAVAWFRSVAISGKRLDRIKRADGRTERLLVDDPSAPPLWARFYELGTNRPLYMDRNSEPVYDFAQIAYERRSGYDYHTEAPATLLDRDYPVWRERRAKAPAPPVPERHRVVVTSDIGGTDPDDYQSMAHLLLCADTLEIEGLISSPFEREGKDKILEVIDAYARDFPNLRTWSAAYPEPEALRARTKQGGVRPAPYSGLRGTTEGSEWIVRCARRDDPRPLHVLVWGALEELAQALHDAPDILPRLRVYYIGGPNKKWGPDAYQYLVDHFPELWIIEANSTYRGYFLGGNQSGEWGNQAFVTRHIAGHGALGDYFAQHLGGTIKMGDTPSVNWLLHGNHEDPASPGWGGRFVRAWDRPQASFDHVTTAADRVEIFSIVELVLRVPEGATPTSPPEARFTLGNQTLTARDDGTGALRFRFCPRDPKVLSYTIASTIPGLDGLSGEITAFLPTPEAAGHPSTRFPHWWTDDPASEVAESMHHGARSISRWREDYLGDFAARMERCAHPAVPASAN